MKQRLFFKFTDVSHGAFPFKNLLQPIVGKQPIGSSEQISREAAASPFFFFPPRQPVTGGQPALLDWTGAGILGVAAQHWPFTELPFSSARVKRSAGARGERREDVGENEGQKVGERWGSKEGVACSCVKSALCSFKIRFFFLSLFLCAIAQMLTPAPSPCSVHLSWN